MGVIEQRIEDIPRGTRLGDGQVRRRRRGGWRAVPGLVVLALALAGGPVAAADLAPEHARVPAARPAEVPPPPPATREIARRVGLSGSVGWMVRDLDTGAVLDASSPTARFVPASVAKLPTAAFALDRLGATHRFRTTVLARGRQNGGRLDGDLVLVGGGDPELDSDAMADLAAAVVGAGLAEATGGVVADPGPFPTIPAIEPNQPADAAYNPGVSGLTLNFNRVRVEWPRGGATISVRAQALAHRPETTAVRVTAVQGLGHGLVPAEGPGSSRVAGMTLPLPQPGLVPAERWLIDRRAMRRAGGRWLPVRRPGLYAGEVMAGLMAARGLEMGAAPRLEPGAATRGGRVVAERASRPLHEVLRAMLWHSTNVSAELMGLAAGRAGRVPETAAPGSLFAVARRTGEPAGDRAERRRLAASAGEMNAWAAGRAGFAPGDPGFAFANHSGLSVASRVSPERMVDLLAALAPEAGLVRAPRSAGGGPLPHGRGGAGIAALLRPHNIAIRNDGLDHANLAVVAKTGTMAFVRGLSGYVVTPGGRRLAFAYFANDLERRAGTRRGSKTWMARARGLERSLLREWVRMADGADDPASPG